MEKVKNRSQVEFKQKDIKSRFCCGERRGENMLVHLLICSQLGALAPSHCPPSWQRELWGGGGIGVGTHQRGDAVKQWTCEPEYVLCWGRFVVWTREPGGPVLLQRRRRCSSSVTPH